MQEEEKQGSVEQARRALQEDAQKRAQAAAAAFNEALARICQQYRVQVRYGTLEWADGAREFKVQFFAE